MANSNNRTFKEFLSLCKCLFNTDDGKRVLAYLKSSYVDSSAVGETPELTYYRLGQKELVQILIQNVNDERELNHIINSIDYTED